MCSFFPFLGKRYKLSLDNIPKVFFLFIMLQISPKSSKINALGHFSSVDVSLCELVSPKITQPYKI